MTGVVACIVCPAIQAADVTVNVTANRSSIYLGESVNLTVKVGGMNNPPQPDLSAIRNCKVRFLGSQSESRHVVMNGRVVESFSGRVFSYELTPSAAGKFIAGPVSLIVEGKTIVAPGPVINVEGVQEQEWVRVSIASSKESVIVDEPFEISFKVALKCLKGRFFNIDPLDPSTPPLLKVPFLEDAPINGLTTPNIKSLLLQRLVSRRDGSGFSINDYCLPPGPFDLGTRRARFMFERTTTTTNGVSYFDYALTLSYTPREEGSYTFGPVEFKGTAIIDVDSSGRGTGKEVFTIGPACTVRVVPPPEEGRPISYVGAIGSNLVAEAALDSQTCNVGDPLTLTLKIGGNISLQNIRPPVLNLQTNLVENFRIYDDTVKTTAKPDSKEYTYTIRAIKTGTFELPPIEVSYFDTRDRVYRTAKTLPIPVRANETTGLTGTNIFTDATNKAESGSQPEAADLTIAPLNMDPAGAQPADIRLQTWQIGVLAAAPLLFVLVLAARYLKARSSEMARTERRRHAARRAIKRLRDAADMPSTDPTAVCHGICSALRSYLADRFDVPESGLAPADAHRILVENRVDQALAADFRDVLERNFNAAFSPDRTQKHDPAGDCERAEQLLKTIEEQIANGNRS